MAAGNDRHLEEMERLGEADRRNGSYHRWLMTEHTNLLTLPAKPAGGL